jgi:iron complex outermembrane receptor protein
MSLKKFIIFSVLLVALPVFSFAANLLKGKITDEKGLVLPGVIVEITDLKTGAATNDSGYYLIQDLPKGTYVVEIHLMSYATVTRSVTIDGETTLNVKLTESVIEKNEVVVTGSSLATEERKNITPIQSISAKEMHQNAYSNVIDAIATLPGVSTVSSGPAISKPVIRGLGYNRIITLNEGVRQEGQQWGDEHGIEIDDYNVTRVEVLKGPASLAYGSDALAGVVNIISKNNTPEGKINGNVTSNYQTNSGLAALHAHVNGNNKGISWGLYSTGKRAHDYQNKYDGHVYNTRFLNTDFGANIGINKSWGSSSLSFSSFDMNTGLPEGERDSATGKFVKATYDYNSGLVAESVAAENDNKSYAPATPSQQINHIKLVWDNNIYLGNGGRIGLVAGYQRNIREEFDNVMEPNTPGLSLMLQTFTYDAKYHLPAVRGWQMSVGLNGMSQWNTNRGDEFLIPDYQLADGGVYAMAKKDIGKWNVAGGLRYDMRTIEAYQMELMEPNRAFVSYQLFAPFKKTYTNFSGSAGAGYNVNEKMIAKLNLASGYRAPNIAELAANGVHEGTIRYEIGSSSLAPERSYQADLGMSYSSEHVMVNASLFNNYIQDFIFIRRLTDAGGIADSIPTVNNDENFSAFIFNQADANLYGGELYVDFHPHPLDWLHFENTFSYVRGKFLEPVENIKNLPYMPAARWITELLAQKRTLGKCIRNAYAKVWMDINAAQKNVFGAYETETPNAGYKLLNAGVGGDITNKKHHVLCTITIAAQNITDVAYQNTLSRLRYAPANNVTGRQGIFNQGRNFSAMVSVPLDFK